MANYHPISSWKKGNVPWNKGIKRPPFSDEWKKKMGDSHRGKKHPPRSAESLLKMSLAQRGKVIPIEVRLKISQTLKKIGAGQWNVGRKTSEETRRKLSLASKGKKVHSEEWKQKLSERWRGENNPSWKGGVSPEHIRLRHSREYKLWRASVFQRDNWTCQSCGQRGDYLQADHVKPFARYPELRFSVDNGRTLCLECHKQTPNFATKSLYMKEI